MARGQTLRFLVVGGGTALGYFLLLLAADWLGLPPLFSHPMAYGLAFAVAYGLQRQWTFRAAAPHATALPRYLLTQLLCGCLAGILGHAAQAADWPAVASAVAVTVAVSGLSFLLSSRWAFKTVHTSLSADDLVRSRL